MGIFLYFPKQYLKELRLELNAITKELGFKICKHFGKTNDSLLIYFCEYGGRERTTESEGKRIKLSKKISKFS